MDNEEKKIVVWLVPSAHWDREWYLSFPRFQTRLVRLIDKVIYLLTSGKYPCYLLDGQTVMLEDYLAIKPQNESVLKRLVKEGKLVIGPWYTVPDTFLPCGESLLKNLELGDSIKKKFGGKGAVAYTPDSFGLNSQLPQIIKKFGYKFLYYSRGERLKEVDLSGKKSDVLLVGKDGTKILSECDKYSTGSGLVVPAIWKNFEIHRVLEGDAIRCAEWTFDYQKSRTAFRNRLWICGTDHLEPREDLPQIAEFLNKEYPFAEFKLGGIDEYFKSIEEEAKTLKPYTASGEQRGDYVRHYELSNTLSSRIDVKLLNREAENSAFNVFESLSIFDKPCKPFDYLDERAIMENSYKELVKSHAHDSICTCCTEETVSDVKGRIRGAAETARELIKEDLKKIGASLKRGTQGGEILVYNPLPYPRKEIIEGFVSVPFDVTGDALADENGKLCEDSFVKTLFKKRIDIETMKYASFAEIAEDETRTYIPDNAEAEDIQTGVYYRVFAELPSHSFKRFSLTTTGQSDKSETSVECFIENGIISVAVAESGEIIIENRKTGEKSGKLYPIIDVDDGDSYTYANVSGKSAEKAENVTLSAVKKTELYSEITVRYEFANAGINGESVTLEATYRVEKESEIVKIRAKVTNEKAYGFRLSFLYEVNGKLKKTYADTPFDLTERPVYEKRNRITDIFTCSLRNVVYAPKENGGTAFYSKSFYEYEAYREKNKSFLLLTLMRSTDKVYDTYLPTKDESGAGRGVRWRSEALKMLGAYEFGFGAELINGNKTNNEILVKALKFQHSPVVFGISPCGDKNVSDYFGVSLKGAVFSRIVEKDGKSGKKRFVRVYNAENKSVSCEASYKGKTTKIKVGKGKIAEIEL